MSQVLRDRLTRLHESLDALPLTGSAANRAEAAGLMLQIARTWDELGDTAREQAMLEQIIDTFEHDPHPDTALSVCTALRSAAINHYRRDELPQAEALNRRARAFVAHPDSRVRRQVLRTLVSYASYLSDQRQHQAERQVYDEIITCFATDPDDAVRELVAVSAFDKAVTEDQLGDRTAEEACYRWLIERMGHETQEAIRVQVCKAHVNLLFNRLREGDFAAALPHADAVLKIADGSPYPGLLDQVARALFGAARIYDNQGRHDREQSTLDDLIARMDGHACAIAKVGLASALVRKGRGFETDFNDPHAAIQCYRRVVERFGDTPLRFDGDPREGWDARLHESMVRQVALALLHSAEAYCNLRDYEQSRTLIDGLHQTYGLSENPDVTEVLDDAMALQQRIERLSGRRNVLRGLFDRFGPVGASGRTH
ncbi:MAG: hypothetical protein QM766_11410 [Burkholderiaceae bacterium]